MAELSRSYEQRRVQVATDGVGAAVAALKATCDSEDAEERKEFVGNVRGTDSSLSAALALAMTLFSARLHSCARCLCLL